MLAALGQHSVSPEGWLQRSSKRPVCVDGAPSLEWRARFLSDLETATGQASAGADGLASGAFQNAAAGSPFPASVQRFPCAPLSSCWCWPGRVPYGLRRSRLVQAPCTHRRPRVQWTLVARTSRASGVTVRTTAFSTSPRMMGGCSCSRPSGGPRTGARIRQRGGACPLPRQLRGGGRRGAPSGRRRLRRALPGRSGELRRRRPGGGHRGQAARGQPVPAGWRARGARGCTGWCGWHPTAAVEAAARRRAALRRRAARELRAGLGPGLGRGSSARRRGNPSGKAPGRAPTSRCPSPRRTRGRR